MTAMTPLLLASAGRRQRRQRHIPSCVAIVATLIAGFLFAARPGVQAFAPSMTPQHRSFPTSASPATTSGLFGVPSSVSDRPSRVRSDALRKKQEWMEQSLNYYSKVMREERRRSMGQATNKDETFTELAKKHYFALYKIRSGQHKQAEVIYRRIIGDLVAEADNEEDDHCDHANLAVTTLLLALHLQRSDRIVETRSVFIRFFRRVADSDHPCACSAKVLGAYALFEMKQGHRSKSLCIAERAAQLDPSLKPVLQWKQFRDVAARRQRQQDRRKQLQEQRS